MFDIVSSNFKEDYKNAAIKYFKQYIGMPNNTIIDLKLGLFLDEKGTSEFKLL